MQQLHDAALIGRAVKDGTAKLGLTLPCKSTLQANDKFVGKLIVSHLESEGVPNCLETSATDLGIETAAGKGDVRQTSGNASGKADEGPRESQPPEQDELGGAKTHDDGHPPCSGPWTHRTRSVHRTGQRDVQELENGHGNGQNPSLRYFHSRLVFR